MFAFWNSCNLGVKLNLTLAAVMTIFTVAITGIFIADIRVAQLNAAIDEELHPARVAILRSELFLRSVAADEIRSLLVPDRVLAAKYRLRMRENERELGEDVETAASLAQDATMQSAIGAMRAAIWGPAGWSERTTAALAMRDAGKLAEAQRAFLQNPAEPIIASAERYRTDIEALVAAKTAEVMRLTLFAHGLVIGLATAALLLGSGMALLLARSVSQSVDATSTAAVHEAAG